MNFFYGYVSDEIQFNRSELISSDLLTAVLHPLDTGECFDKVYGVISYYIGTSEHLLNIFPVNSEI